MPLRSPVKRLGALARSSNKYVSYRNRISYKVCEEQAYRYEYCRKGLVSSLNLQIKIINYKPILLLVV